MSNRDIIPALPGYWLIDLLDGEVVRAQVDGWEVDRRSLIPISHDIDLSNRWSGPLASPTIGLRRPDGSVATWKKRFTNEDAWLRHVRARATEA